MKGRKPKNSQIRLVESKMVGKGQPRGHGRPLNNQEPRPENVPPPRPTFLQGEELKAWRYVTAELERMGILGSSDQGDITAYCHWWGILAKAKRKMIAQTTEEDPSPEVITTKSGNLIQNPWLGISNTAAKELTKVCEKLGLDPTSRARLKVEPPNLQSRREKLLS